MLMFISFAMYHFDAMCVCVLVQCERLANTSCKQIDIERKYNELNKIA